MNCSRGENEMPALAMLGAEVLFMVKLHAVCFESLDAACTVERKNVMGGWWVFFNKVFLFFAIAFSNGKLHRLFRGGRRVMFDAAIDKGNQFWLAVIV